MSSACPSASLGESAERVWRECDAGKKEKGHGGKGEHHLWGRASSVLPPIFGVGVAIRHGNSLQPSAEAIRLIVSLMDDIWTAEQPIKEDASSATTEASQVHKYHS